jgi:hypothetical protein
MILPLLLAAAMMQADDLEMFAEQDGWQIARTGNSCLMTQEFGGTGNTILTFSIDPELADTPLRILVGNSRWTLPNTDDDGYVLDFGGVSSAWTDLTARTFSSEAEDGSVDGVISIGFNGNRMTPVLDDVAAARGLRLSKGGLTISEIAFTGAEGAIRSLGECVRSLS